MRINGSLRGKRRTPSLASAPGTWGPDEVLLARQNSEWPIPPLGTVAALYHFENSLASSFSGPTLSASGTNPPSCDATATKFGSYGLKCNGTGVLVTATNSAFALGAGDFCIEFWVKTPTAGNSSTKAMLAISTTGAYDVGMIWSNGQWMAWYGPNGSFNTNVTFWDTDWHHVALVRLSGVIKMYWDGVLATGSVSDSTNYSANARLSVGSCGDGSYALPGWIDEVRVTKGHAVYTENFTPPTAAFPDS